tara:strand:+ start:2254 stop:3633 length:1380 start_codon:yes stop_codon:yes gene_type:complete
MKENNPFYSMRKVLLLSASFLFLFQACKKDGVLVPDFEENKTFSFFSDTTKITTKVKRSEPARVTPDQIPNGLVGEYRDSAFGYTKSSIHVQPLLSSNALVFSDGNEVITVDSVILSLEYGGFYGDTTTSMAQTFDVFRIDEELQKGVGVTYPSDTVIAIQPTPLASYTFTPDLKKRTVLFQPDNFGAGDTIDVSPQLRINLGNALGEEIIAKQGSSELATDINFVNFFKGLQITPQINPSLVDNEAAILYFRLTATNTKMTIYYTATSSTDTTQKAVDFPINTNSVRFSTFEHDYTGSAAETALQTQNSNFAFVQAMAGLETVIKFPDLKTQLGGKILVNKAELIIPAVNGSYSRDIGKASEVTLASKGVNSNGDTVFQFIPDALINTQFFGGQFDELNNEYKLNISRYVQSYLNGNQNENGLTLLVTGGAVSAERVVVFNENNTSNKIRLNLYYTKY